MHIAILLAGTLCDFPPAINLTKILCAQGHKITLLANAADDGLFSDDIANEITIIDLGARETRTDKAKQLLKTRVELRSFIKQHTNDVDLFWCMTDLTAREAGPALEGKRYVINLSELVEYVPFVTSKPMFLHSNKTIALARNASAVVCPEYNRAHIQRVWWDLPRVPFVLPNYPTYSEPPSFRVEDSLVREQFENERRKILLYQGVFSMDRSFAALPKALEMLGPDYCLYLMGKGMSPGSENEVRSIAATHEQIRIVNFVPAPFHLSYTPYGFIGLLPYMPTKGGRCSSLNALFCAPNKIWEYARVGLPMIGSDVPGLNAQFKATGAGITIDMNDAYAIEGAVRAIERDYSTYREGSIRLYNSCDPYEIVSEILESCGGSSHPTS